LLHPAARATKPTPGRRDRELAALAGAPAYVLLSADRTGALKDWMAEGRHEARERGTGWQAGNGGMIAYKRKGDAGDYG